MHKSRFFVSYVRPRVDKNIAQCHAKNSQALLRSVTNSPSQTSHPLHKPRCTAAKRKTPKTKIEEYETNEDFSGNYCGSGFAVAHPCRTRSNERERQRPARRRRR